MQFYDHFIANKINEISLSAYFIFLIEPMEFIVFSGIFVEPAAEKTTENTLVFCTTKETNEQGKGKV